MHRARGSVRISWVFVVLAWLLVSVLPLSAQMPAPSNGRGRRFSISGTLRDSQSNNAIEGAKVDLRAVTGGIVSTVFTNSIGSFQFDGIPAGNYSLVITQVGYDQLNQDVTVEGGPIMGLQLELRRLSDPHASNPKGPGKISARELGIPGKAQDAMQKGMRLLYEKSDYSGAIAEFQRALKAYPNYYEAEMQMGMAYMKLGDASSAEQVLHKSLEMNSEYGDAYGALALLLCNEKRFEDAEPAARKAVELDADSWQANFELGRALYGLNRLAEAEPSVQAAINLRPDDGALRLLSANIDRKSVV